MWLYPEIRTLGDFPSYYARTDPARTALKSGGKAVNFGDFDRITNKVGEMTITSVRDKIATGTYVGAAAKVGYLARKKL